MANFKKSRGIQTKNASTMPEMKEFLPNISKDDVVKDSYETPKLLPRYESATVLPNQSTG